MGVFPIDSGSRGVDRRPRRSLDAGLTAPPPLDMPTPSHGRFGRRCARAALALALCGATACSGRHTHVADESFEVEFPLPAEARTVRLDILEGAITFAPGKPGVVRIEALARRASTDAAGIERLAAIDARPVVVPGRDPAVFDLRGPRLPDGLSYPGHRLVTRCYVEVPPDIAVEGTTGSGHMAAVERRADVALQTGHGALRLDNCAGHAMLRSTRGAVVVDEHSGSLDLEHAVWQGETIPETSQRKGETMQLFFTAIGEKGVRVVAPHANVQCHLPGDATFTMDATTGAGRSKNGFGVPVEPLAGKKFGTAMRGTVGSGGPTVLIAVDYGNVSLRARAVP